MVAAQHAQAVAAAEARSVAAGQRAGGACTYRTAVMTDQYRKYLPGRTFMVELCLRITRTLHAGVADCLDSEADAYTVCGSYVQTVQQLRHQSCTQCANATKSNAGKASVSCSCSVILCATGRRSASPAFSATMHVTHHTATWGPRDGSGETRLATML